MENKTFFFTYGTEKQPFWGGWTEITAPTYEIACAVFRAYHPDREPGLLNCSSVYGEETFKKTEMYQRGNFGYFCQEKIAVLIDWT